MDTKLKMEKGNAIKVKHKLHQQNEGGERKAAMVVCTVLLVFKVLMKKSL